MNPIKSLEWHIRKSDGVVHADPHGLRYAYYIRPEENGFELAFIEHGGQFDANLSKTFSSVALAQQYAQSHYNEIVSNLLVQN